MKRIAFLVSGSGTNMENLVKVIQSGEIKAEPALVVSNRPDVKALERAAGLGVEACVIDHKIFDSREAFDRAMDALLQEYKIELVCLCGFMRILTEDFVKHWWGRMINIHPSYLPSFPGAHAIQDAFEAKVSETGVTVHFVDPGVDSGPVILQEKVPVLGEDTLEALEDRIHALEYQIYPQALAKVLGGFSPETPVS